MSACYVVPKGEFLPRLSSPHQPRSACAGKGSPPTTSTNGPGSNITATTRFSRRRVQGCIILVGIAQNRGESPGSKVASESVFTVVEGEFDLVVIVCMWRNDLYLLRKSGFVYDFHLSDFKSDLLSNRGNNTNTASFRGFSSQFQLSNILEAMMYSSWRTLREILCHEPTVSAR